MWCDIGGVADDLRKRDFLHACLRVKDLVTPEVKFKMTVPDM